MHPLPTLGDFLLPNSETILGHQQVDAHLRASTGLPGVHPQLSGRVEMDETKELQALRSSGPGQVAGCACRRTTLREMPQCAKEIHGVSGLHFCTEGLKEGLSKKAVLEQGLEGEKVLGLLRGQARNSRGDSMRQGMEAGRPGSTRFCLKLAV